MLDKIRKNVRHPYIQVLLGMVIIVFVLFFGWSMSSQKPTYVAKVNRDVIDFRSYQQVYNGLMRIYQETFGGDISADKLRQLGIGRRALDQMIDQVLLAQEAARRDLKVSDDELEASIQAVTAFHDQGRFVKSLYLQVLEANRVTPLEYEANKRQELLLSKVEQSIRAEATVTDQDVMKEYDERNTKADLEFVSFDPAVLRSAIKPSEKELSAFYEANKEGFRTPERRAARYVLFRPEPHLSKVSVTQDEIAKEYNIQLDRFTVKEEVRARHILFLVPKDAKPEEEGKVRQKAEAARKELRAGKNFAELAKKSSDDPGSKDKGGDLGYFGRGQMVPEFDQAAFSLKVGEISEPVRTPYGFHLIKVEDHRQARQRPLEEVKGELEAELKKRKALEFAYNEADAVLMSLEDKKETWDSLAKKHAVAVSAPITREGALEGVAKGRQIVEMLFGLEPAKSGNLLESEQGTYLVGVAQVIAPAVPPLAEVKGQLEGRYREAESKKLAQKKAAEFLEAAKKSGWDSAAKAAGVKSETTGPFTKKGGAMPKIVGGPEMREAAFALAKAGDLAPKAFEAGGKFYVFRLASKTPADPAGLAAQKEAIRAALQPQKQNERVEETLKKLRESAKITINEELLM